MQRAALHGHAESGEQGRQRLLLPEVDSGGGDRAPGTAPIEPGLETDDQLLLETDEARLPARPADLLLDHQAPARRQTVATVGEDCLLLFETPIHQDVDEGDG